MPNNRRLLASEEREKNAQILSNLITDCMMERQMTIEHLEYAMDIVIDAFKKDATLRKNKID